MFLDLLAREDSAVGQSQVGDAGDAATPIRMGTGPCTICDCQGFVPAPGGSGRSCIGTNSAGGTCNHWDSEHV